MNAPLLTPDMATIPTDDELQLFADYVDGEMTDEQAESFEDRMAEDPGLFYRMAPMLKVWYAAPGAREVEIADAALRRHRMRTAKRRTIRRAAVWLGGGVAFAAAAALTFAVVRLERRPRDTSGGHSYIPPVAQATPPLPAKRNPATPKRALPQPVTAVAILPSPLLDTLGAAASAERAARPSLEINPVARPMPAQRVVVFEQPDTIGAKARGALINSGGQAAGTKSGRPRFWPWPLPWFGKSSATGDGHEQPKKDH